MTGRGTTPGEDAGPYDDEKAAPEPSATWVHVPLPPTVVESALVVGPGDILVIRARPDVTSYALDEIAALLRATPLQGRVLVVAAEQIGAVRP